MWNFRGEELCLICDIGTTEISVATAYFAPHQKPLILSLKRVPLGIQEEAQDASEAHILSLLHSIITPAARIGLAEAKKKRLRQSAIKRVFITLSSPWYISKSVKITIEKTQPFLITEEAIQASVLIEEQKFEKEALTSARKEFRGKGLKTIEREVISVDLNGYRTIRPYGKEATVAQVTVFMSIMSLELFSKIRECVVKELHMHEVTFHTFPLAFFGAMSRLYPREENALLIHVAGESTSISLVEKGTLIASTSFRGGVNGLIRSVMERFSLPEAVARSYIRLMGTGKGEADFVQSLQSALIGYGESWSKEYQKSIDQMVDSAHLPRTCFLVSQKGMNPAFTNFLKTLNGDHVVIALDTSSLLEQAEAREGIKDAECTLLEAFYLEYHDIHLSR